MSSLIRMHIAAGIVASAVAACGAPGASPPAQVDAAENAHHKQAFVEALQPRGATRPLVAILAHNDGTETTDLLLPHAVLQRSGVADVQLVAPTAGVVKLYPALQVDGAQALAEFDRVHPAGADYVIVPAMDPDDDPAVATWLREQSAHGARIVGICSGARVLAEAGLLDGRRFAGHWYDRDRLLREPGAAHVPNRRYLIDRGVATTTGISASLPTMLALVEAIGGYDEAQALADELGIDSWGPAHDSAAFGLDLGRAWSYVVDKLAFWRDERWIVDVHEGIDDVVLALAVDAWSRTGRVEVEAASPGGAVTLRSGLVLITQTAATEVGTPRLSLQPQAQAVPQLDRTLCDIAERFGEPARERVLLEMEYPGGAADCPSASG